MAQKNLIKKQRAHITMIDEAWTGIVRNQEVRKEKLQSLQCYMKPDYWNMQLLNWKYPL